VWFDALTNYISLPAALGDPVVNAPLGRGSDVSNLKSPSGPPISTASARDIIKFRTVCWPIMLQAIWLPLPRQVLVHGSWHPHGQSDAHRDHVPAVPPAA
jgi:methionyl-tRNA synthetase